MKFYFSSNKPIGHGFFVSVIGLVTLIYTWQLLIQLTVAIPGRFDLTDTTETIWSVGWVSQALTNGANVWHTDRLFVPYGADLRFNVFGLLQGLMAYPFVSWLGVVGASNLVIILTMFINGVFAYLLVWRHTDHQLAALLASICHMLSLSVVWHFSAGRNALPAVWIVSGSLLSLKSLLDHPSIWRGLLFGCTLLAALFTDFQVVVFTLLWTVFYLSAYIWKNGVAKIPSSLLVPILVAFSIFLLVFGVVFGSVIPSLNRGEFPTQTLEDAAYYAFSIKDFVTSGEIPFIYGFDNLISIILAVVFFKWQGEYRIWLIGSLFFLILSLGPYLKPTHLPLPYAIASIWTPLLNFRATYRFVIPATVGLTMVMGHVLAFLLPRLLRQTYIVITCVVFILFRLLYTIHIQPFETQVYPNYNFYHDLAMDSNDYVIMEVPFGIRSGFEQIGHGGERLQYYQHVHGKKILNGSLARLPNSLFNSFRSHPSLLFFSGDMSVDRSDLNKDFQDVLIWTEPKYIVVHRNLLTEGQLTEIELFLNRQAQLEVVGLEGDLVIYKIMP